MKRTSEPSNVIMAVLPDQQPGPFIELAFLPWKIVQEDGYPAWAERGIRRKQWNSLTAVEKRVSFFLLGHRGDQVIRPSQPVTPADVKRHQKSCLKKLGFADLAELLEFHRARNAAMLQRVRDREGSKP